VSEALRTVLVAFGALAVALTWQSARATMTPSESPQRLIEQLRLAQMAALLLSLTAGAYIGFAVVAAMTMVRDPRQALMIVALGFTAHAVLDIAHRPGLLPEALAPRWYAVGCAVYDVYIAAVCYLPVLRR
jgi:hypothetical protein